MIDYLVDQAKSAAHQRRPSSLGIRLSPNSTIETTSPPWLPSLERRVNTLLHLPENWDSYGAPRISCESVMAAFSLILPNVIHETPEPQFVPTSMGGIQVEWHIGAVDLEILFNPGAVASYFHSDVNGVEIEGDVPEDPWLVGSLIRALPKRNDVINFSR